MNNFTKEMVDDLANKLLIGLTDEENKMVLDDFNYIEENMNLITKIKDIDSVTPMTHALDDFAYELASDVPTESLSLEEITKNSGDVRDNQIAIPKVVN